MGELFAQGHTVLMAKTDQGSIIGVFIQNSSWEKNTIPPCVLCKALRCAGETLLTHLKSFSLEGILHSSSGRMSSLKGPVRAQRLSKNLTQAFSTCQTPQGEGRPRCTSLWDGRMSNSDTSCTVGHIVCHVHRTCSTECHSLHISAGHCDSRGVHTSVIPC